MIKRDSGFACVLGVCKIEPLDGSDDYKWLEQHEVVSLVGIVGKYALIRPFRSRRLYKVEPMYLDIFISQNVKDYVNLFGVRKLRSRVEHILNDLT